jgi:hypothetical protein
MEIEQRSDGAIATIGRKVLAWVVLIGAGLLVVKIVGGIVLGLVYTVLTVVAVIAAVVAVIWAAKRL